jgi:hypothetical protein
VTPSLHIDYKHGRIKQYHKQGRALRTETTINDAYDFALDKRLTNLPALRQIGFSANRRLLRVQRLSHDPARRDHRPGYHRDRAPRARDALHRPRAQALLSALCVFRLLPRGFTNRDLRAHLAPQLGLPPEDWPADRSRLRTHRLIERIPHTHRYQVTDLGLRHALFLTRVHIRLLRTGLAEIHGPPVPTKLQSAARAYETAINNLMQTSALAA